MNSYNVLLSTHFFKKCCIIYILPTGDDNRPLWVKSLICTGFSMFNLVLTNINNFRTSVIKNKLDFALFWLSVAPALSMVQKLLRG